MFRSIRNIATVLLVAVMASACGGGEDSAAPSPSVSIPAMTGPTLPPSTGSAAASAAGTPAAEPSDNAGAFSCDLPIHLEATVARANILDVRVGTHATYDRIVFEFNDGIPEAMLERATPPFSHDASGEPIEVHGDSFLRLTLIGGTKQTDTGQSSYTGPTSFETTYPMLAHLIEGGDFEGRSTWYIGLHGEACVRVSPLVGEGGAPRLVVDVEH